MSVLRPPTECPYCGGLNHYNCSLPSYTCIACGQVVPLTEQQRLNAPAVLDKLDQLAAQAAQKDQQLFDAQFEQAVSLQHSRKFTEAEKMFRDLLIKGGRMPQLYWHILMCQYCVEYQQGDDGKYIPFVLYPNLTPLSSREEYAALFACVQSEDEKRLYREKLDEVDNILSRYRELRTTVQYDVFISVKQTGRDGGETPDSRMGSDLYNHLTLKGLRVFNSKRTPIPPGQEFEPYIIAALISAKVMIVVGSSAEYMNARWVQNEWSRFQWLQQREGGGRKLVCCLTGGMSGNSIPRALNPNIQAIVDDIYAKDTLDRFMQESFPDKYGKNAGKEKNDAESLALRGEVKLELGDFEEAQELFLNAIDKDPKCARAYMGLTLVKLQLRSVSKLAYCEQNFEEMAFFQKAVQFADENTAADYRLLAVKAKRHRTKEVSQQKQKENERLRKEKAEVRRQKLEETVQGWKDSAKTKRQEREETARERTAQQAQEKPFLDLYNQLLSLLKMKKGKDASIQLRNRLESGNCCGISGESYLWAAGEYEKLAQYRDAKFCTDSCRQLAKLAERQAADAAQRVLDAKAQQQKQEEKRKQAQTVALANADKRAAEERLFQQYAQITQFIGLRKEKNASSQLQSRLENGNFSGISSKNYLWAADEFEKIAQYQDANLCAHICRQLAALADKQAAEEAQRIREAKAKQQQQEEARQRNAAEKQRTDALKKRYNEIAKTLKLRKAQQVSPQLEKRVRKKKFAGLECVVYNSMSDAYDKISDYEDAALCAQYCRKLGDMSLAAAALKANRKKRNKQNFLNGFIGLLKVISVLLLAVLIFIGVVGPEKSLEIFEAGKEKFLQIVEDAKEYFDSKKTLTQRYRDLYRGIGYGDIAAGLSHGAYVSKNGTVYAAGNNHNGQCDLDGSDIVAVFVGDNHTIGLKNDGTLVAAGSNSNGQCNISKLRNVVAVSATAGYTAVVLADGTVSYAGTFSHADEACRWKDIVAVSGEKQYLLGLTKDGKVVSAGLDAEKARVVSRWGNVVGVSAANSFVVAVRKDGKVLATGSNSFGQCNVTGWKNIVAVDTGYNHTVGLKKDGTVVAVGNNSARQCEVSGWKDIVAISACGNVTLGLKKDGTVVMAGSTNYSKSIIPFFKIGSEKTLK